MEEKEIQPGDISMLFHNHQIEKVLSNIDVSEIEKITPDFILEEASHIKSVNVKFKMGNYGGSSMHDTAYICSKGN